MKSSEIFESMNFGDLTAEEIGNLKSAISNGEDFIGYIPGRSFDFIVQNYRSLAELGALENNWMGAYIHASHFEATPLDLLQKIFDACDKRILQERWPIKTKFSTNDRYTLFRGCAGSNHRMGMSWIPSLDKAIWYAAHHVEYYDLENPVVYVATVQQHEIYCCGNHYDDDFIVRPQIWWPINIPKSEFRLDRVR